MVRVEQVSVSRAFNRVSLSKGPTLNPSFHDFFSFHEKRTKTRKHAKNTMFSHRFEYEEPIQFSCAFSIINYRCGTVDSATQILNCMRTKNLTEVSVSKPFQQIHSCGPRNFSCKRTFRGCNSAFNRPRNILFFTCFTIFNQVRIQNYMLLKYRGYAPKRKLL